MWIPSIPAGTPQLPGTRPSPARPRPANSSIVKSSAIRQASPTPPRPLPYQLQGAGYPRHASTLSGMKGRPQMLNGRVSQQKLAMTPSTPLLHNAVSHSSGPSTLGHSIALSSNGCTSHGIIPVHVSSSPAPTPNHPVPSISLQQISCTVAPSPPLSPRLRSPPLISATLLSPPLPQRAGSGTESSSVGSPEFPPENGQQVRDDHGENGGTGGTSGVRRNPLVPKLQIPDQVDTPHENEKAAPVAVNVQVAVRVNPPQQDASSTEVVWATQVTQPSSEVVWATQVSQPADHVFWRTNPGVSTGSPIMSTGAQARPLQTYIQGNPRSSPPQRSVARSPSPSMRYVAGEAMASGLKHQSSVTRTQSMQSMYWNPPSNVVPSLLVPRSSSPPARTSLTPAMPRVLPRSDTGVSNVSRQFSQPVINCLQGSQELPMVAEKKGTVNYSYGTVAVLKGLKFTGGCDLNGELATIVHPTLEESAVLDGTECSIVVLKSSGARLTVRNANLVHTEFR